MKRAALAVGALVIAFGLFVLVVSRREFEPKWELPPDTEIPAASPGSAAEAQHGFLYGRVTTDVGATYEGRLRWGGSEEAFWGDYFNGYKDDNTWRNHVPEERLKESHPVKLFGMKIAESESVVDLSRPFASRFGDIVRIESRVRDVVVTLKSGGVFELNRFNADDLADGLRVWDAEHGVVDLPEHRIQSVELLPTADLGTVSGRLHGTVRTSQGEFTGFVQWNREKSVGSDELSGRSDDGDASLRFDTIRSIERESHGSSRVTLLDGSEVVLSGSREAGDGHRGIFVDDPRYGRVLIRWGAFERVDFSPGGSGPAFDEFPPGGPLTGSVTTHTGRRVAGRLVYDLDESETTETLDAPSQGVIYMIPFGLIASVIFPADDIGATVKVALHSREELELEPTGDLGEMNSGMLVFVDGSERPEYVPWSEVERIDFNRPAVMYPAIGWRHGADSEGADEQRLLESHRE